MAGGSGRRARLAAASAVLIGAVLFLVGAALFIAFNAEALYTTTSGIGASIFAVGAFMLRRVDKPST